MENEIKRKIRVYLENGIGYNCNTNEFYDLQIEFKRSKEILLTDLALIQNDIFVLEDKIRDIDYKNDGALAIIQKDAYFDEIVKLKKRINLIVIALQYNSIDEFISNVLKRG